MTLLFLAVSLLAPQAAAQPTSSAVFEKRLETDLIKSVTDWHVSFLKTHSKDNTRLADGYGILGMARLHARTKDPKYATWAREELQIMSAAHRVIHPFNVASYIEAFLYFRDGLPAATRAASEDLIRLTLRGARLEYLAERLNRQTAVEVRSMPRSEVLQAWDKGEMNDSPVQEIVIESLEDEK